jgi:esterase/lipase superfamily enzyme
MNRARHASRPPGDRSSSTRARHASPLRGWGLRADTYLTNPLAFLPGLADERYLGPLRTMGTEVIVTGKEDANVEDSIRLAEALRGRDVGVRLDLWVGWAHDWPYWKEMMRTYL